MKTIKLAELVVDFELYPRSNVDSKNVTMLVDSLESGDTLPPIIIDQQTNRIIDGVHRYNAHKKFHGEDCEVEVVAKEYRNDGEMFLDAMKYNAAHGCKLDPCDRNRCVIVAERLGLSIEVVAGALHMPAGKLGDLHNTRTATHGGLSVPLKRTVRHMAGRKLTKRQRQANDKLSGMNQAFYANQLIELIESNMLNLEDEGTAESLRKLHGLLEGILVAA